MSIIRELKKKRMAEINKTAIDESAEDLRYEEVYAIEDIADIETFKKDIEAIGGEVIENGEDITVRVPHEQKIALESVEEKYFDNSDEGCSKKKIDEENANFGKDQLVFIVPKKLFEKELKKSTGFDLSSDEWEEGDMLELDYNGKGFYNLKGIHLTKIETYSKNTSKYVVSIDDQEYLKPSKKKVDEAFGVATGFENVLSISGSKEELIAIAKKLGINIKDVKVNKTAEKEFKAGNAAGISEGVHLVALTKDKKHPENLMLVIDKEEYIPDAEEVNESAEDDMIIKVAGNDFPMKNLLKSDKSVSKRVKEILKKENGSIDIDFFGNTVYPMLHEDFPEYFNETFSGILEEIGRPLTSKELKTISKNIDKLENDDDLWEQKNISKYILDNYDESEKETCYEMEIPMEKLVDEDGEKLDINEILEAVKACKGVNEAEALEDCIRVKYDEEAEDEVLNVLEECGVVLDIEDETDEACGKKKDKK